MTVQRILDSQRSTNRTHILPNASVMETLELLARENVGATVVSSDGVRVDGIVSERDIVRHLRRAGPSLLERPVRELMTHDVVTCVAEDRAAGIMSLMVSRHLRHVPVLESGRYLCMVSIRDLLQLRLDEVQSEAESMRSYISGCAA